MDWEQLNGQILGIDASIWFHQFVKATATAGDTRSSDPSSQIILGFMRRICKLLYHGVQPVFVFDGGVPVLKRETIKARRDRREGMGEKADDFSRQVPDTLS